MAYLQLDFSVGALSVDIHPLYVRAFDGSTQVRGIFLWHAALTDGSTKTLMAANPANSGMYARTSPSAEAGWYFMSYRNFGQGEIRSWSSGILALNIQNTSPGSTFRVVHVLGPGGVYGKKVIWFP